MRNTLEKSREAAESERAQLMGLVRTLEGKLAEQSQNAREERWALQQAAATLTARASALDRESEFNRALLERERKQIKAWNTTGFALCFIISQLAQCTDLFAKSALSSNL